MAENTKIEWAHHTFNPWMGCAKISPGCDHCYAEGWAKRSGLVEWGAKADRRRSSTANWRKPLTWNDEAARLGIRYRVFCASLADVFDSDVPSHWRRDLFDLIEMTPHLDWLLVTKRIGNVPRLIREVRPGDWLQGRSNVWLGITVVNQEEADRDIPKLLKIPAAVRFLSMEPLLSGVDLSQWLDLIQYDDGAPWMRRNIGHLHDMLDWVIVGGESGPGARPMNPDWVWSLRDQCAAAGVPFLFKQWGEWVTAGHPAFGTVRGDVRHIRADGSFWGDELPDDEDADVLTVVRVGKKAAGRLICGHEHNGYPMQSTEAGGVK